MDISFFIFIAGYIIKIHNIYPSIKKICHEYLYSDNKVNRPAFEVYIQKTDIQYGSESLTIQKKIADNMPEYDTFLMHGAVVALDRDAYMFIAPSGTGKSKRAELWMEEFPGAFIVNGDKPFVRITDKEALACGSPWCGKEMWNTNTMVPLKAIFLVERDDDDAGMEIREMDPVEAFPQLYQFTYSPESAEGTRKTLELLKALEERVKVFRFRSKPSREGVRAAYEAVKGW